MQYLIPGVVVYCKPFYTTVIRKSTTQLLFFFKYQLRIIYSFSGYIFRHEQRSSHIRRYLTLYILVRDTIKVCWRTRVSLLIVNVTCADSTASRVKRLGWTGTGPASPLRQRFLTENPPHRSRMMLPLDTFLKWNIVGAFKVNYKNNKLIPYKLNE